MRTIQELREKLLQLVIESERYSPEEIKTAAQNIQTMSRELLEKYITTIETYKAALEGLDKLEEILK